MVLQAALNLRLHITFVLKILKSKLKRKYPDDYNATHR
jgi:hypothetical protein